MMHPLVRLARQAVESHVRNGEVAATPEDLSAEMLERAGVFVCLKKKGDLRGCIGTIQPVTGCAAEETIKNAIAAATEDPRFPPVGHDELDDLDYSVDVLCPPERINGLDQLDPKKYGVIVAKDFRRGLLLPDLPGVETAEEQLRITMMKAGIAAGEPDAEVYRFEVRRYT
jgi:AmmeMemoRadiSam system protein A